MPAVYGHEAAGVVEETCGIELRAPGFPAELVDDERQEPGYGVVVHGRAAAAE